MSAPKDGLAVRNSLRLDRLEVLCVSLEFRYQNGRYFTMEMREILRDANGRVAGLAQPPSLDPPERCDPNAGWAANMLGSRISTNRAKGRRDKAKPSNLKAR
jgi:hypothetical protein